MRSKRRNYVIDNNTKSSKTNIPSSVTQPNSSNNDVSSTITTTSSLPTHGPAHGSINSLNDNFNQHNQSAAPSFYASCSDLIENER